jgi:hypothetical protein
MKTKYTLYRKSCLGATENSDSPSLIKSSLPVPNNDELVKGLPNLPFKEVISGIDHGPYNLGNRGGEWPPLASKPKESNSCFINAPFGMLMRAIIPIVGDRLAAIDAITEMDYI